MALQVHTADFAASIVQVEVAGEFGEFGNELNRSAVMVVDRLNDVDTSGVEPMAQVLFQAGETATLRADVPVPPLSNQAALANAPQPGAGYFKVPQIVER